MGQEDRFKRELDQLAKVLGKMLGVILGIKEQGKSEENFFTAKNELKQFPDLDPEFLSILSKEAFLKYLLEKNYTNHHLGLIGDILFESAEIAPDKKTSEAFYIKALALYLYLSENDKTYSFDRHFKMQRINNVIKESINSIPFTDLTPLFTDKWPYLT